MLVLVPVRDGKSSRGGHGVSSFMFVPTDTFILKNGFLVINPCCVILVILFVMSGCFACGSGLRVGIVEAPDVGGTKCICGGWG